MGMNMGSQSSLDKLLSAWGIAFDGSKVVADLDFVGRTREGRQPAVLALNEKATNREDIVSAESNNLILAFAGAFSGTPAEGLKQTILVHSSKNSQLVEPMSAQFGGEKLVKDFVSSNTEHTLALRLTGKFKTAFPDGKPKGAAPTADAAPEKKSGETGLKESKEDGAVVLIGDSDFIQDQLTVQEMVNPFGGQRMVTPVNSNLAFAQSAIEQVAGDSNLVAVRSRASRERQFIAVRQMQAKAESAFQAKIKSLEGSLAETQNSSTNCNAPKPTKADRNLSYPPNSSLKSTTSATRSGT
jgi:ABC-type uncharacterized transport system involved in gliding motility auxiliary subunit